MRAKMCGTLILSVLCLVGATGVAVAAPTVAITSPTEGQVVKRSSSPTLDVLGTATFGTPTEATRRFYVRRDGCGTANDHLHLSTNLGTDAGDGCGNALNVISNSTTTYAAEDGLPFTINAAKKIAGQITTSSFQGLQGSPVGAGVGQQSVSIDIIGSTDESAEVLLHVDKTYLVTPVQPEYVTTFDGEINDDLAGQLFTGLTLSITYTSGVLLHGFTGASGSSWFDVPILDTGTVEVSDSSTFSAARTVFATLEGGTWVAELPMPNVGNRRIYARAKQSGETTVASVGISVTS